MASRLRLAVIGTRGLPPLYGGGETATDELSRRLVRRGHEVVVYCRYHNSAPPRPHFHHGVRLVHLPSLHTKNLDTPTHIILSALHAICCERIDVVLLSGVGTWFIIPLLQLFGIRTVMWADGKDWERGKWGAFARWYLRWSARMSVRFSDGIVTDTTIAHAMYRDELGRETDYIPYGANIEAIEGTAELERWGLQPDRYILFVGRLIPEKGVHYLIDAFSSVETDCRLVVVGDNPYNPDYVERLKSTSDKRVLFTGYVFGDGFKQLMKNCAIYVQPSDVEGTSPVLLTAMGYRRAIIVNGIPENLATVQDTALSFRPEHSGELAARISHLLGDEHLRAEYGSRAESRVREHYDWERISDEFESLFERLAVGVARTAIGPGIETDPSADG